MAPAVGDRVAFTTGACAAAAAQAATVLLLTGSLPDTVSIQLAVGKRAVIPIDRGRQFRKKAAAAVVKGKGGDADITAGVRIWAEVRRTNEGIRFYAGRGVGVVTEPGLAAAVGEAAINPAPRQMIINAVFEAGMTEDSGFDVVISVENGEALAKKTFNPKLGIVGGISILGTTGIVRPMSEKSWRRSLLPQIDLAKAAGYNRLVLTFGNLGEKAALKQGFKERQIVQMSNFVGYMVEACGRRDVSEILLLGHLGKMIKIADGHFDTHSSRAPQHLRLLRDFAAVRGFDNDILMKIAAAKSGESVISVLGASGRPVFEAAATAAEQRLNGLTRGTPPVSVAITNLAGDIVGAGERGASILERVEQWR